MAGRCRELHGGRLELARRGRRGGGILGEHCAAGGKLHAVACKADAGGPLPDLRFERIADAGRQGRAEHLREGGPIGDGYLHAVGHAVRIFRGRRTPRSRVAIARRHALVPFRHGRREPARGVLLEARVVDGDDVLCLLSVQPHVIEVGLRRTRLHQADLEGLPHVRVRPGGEVRRRRWDERADTGEGGGRAGEHRPARPQLNGLRRRGRAVLPHPHVGVEGVEGVGGQGRAEHLRDRGAVADGHVEPVGDRAAGVVCCRGVERSCIGVRGRYCPFAPQRQGRRESTFAERNGLEAGVVDGDRGRDACRGGRAERSHDTGQDADSRENAFVSHCPSSPGSALHRMERKGG